MDTETPDPGIAVEPASATCPHCGAGCSGVADPTRLNCAALGALVEIGVRLASMVAGQAEAAGDLDQERAVVLEIVSRNLRRTVALSQRIYADSKKTPEQLATERAERAAAVERERLRYRKHVAPGRALPGAPAAIKAESGPSDRENLLGDMHERLLPPAAELALLPEDVSTITLHVLQDFEIAPRKEIWSDALMAHEIAVTHGELQRLDAERAAGQDAAAQGADWRDGVEFSRPPDVETKIGRFTFAPGGALVHEDPPETPESEWPPDIVGGRPLPNLLRGRKPPDTG